MRLSTFCIFLLAFLVSLLVGAGFLLIHHPREIVADSVQACAAYQATTGHAAQIKAIKARLWLVVASSPQEEEDAWNACWVQLHALAAVDGHAAPVAQRLADRLNGVRTLSHQRADVAAAMRTAGEGEGVEALGRRRDELEASFRAAVSGLAELAEELGGVAVTAEAMAASLKKNAASAQEQENHILFGLVFSVCCIVLLVWLLWRQLVRPLEDICAYAKQLGTGVPVSVTARSLFRDVAETADKLENIAAYLGQATVRSEKMETEHSRFRRMSLYDGLTGLHNRRAFDETLQAMWDAAAQTGAPLGLILLDVDKFKIYNDMCGHQAGDDCLRKVAGAIARAVRSEDFCGRYGGEEFVVILPGTDAAQACAAAEHIRAAVESVRLPHPGSPVGPYVTVSLGVASVRGSAGSAPTDIIGHADKALYLSKEKGRNRATLYGEAAD